MTANPTDDVLIIGGGITGLSAAWRLAEAGRRVTVIEAAPRAGGVVETLRDGDWQAELGPNTLLARPALYETLRDLGALDSVILANGAGARRYLAKGGKLQALPRDPISALLSGLTRPALPALFRDLRAKPLDGPDESIASFIRRHFGDYVLRQFIDPFVSGTNGGDPERLSVRAAMPRLALAEGAGNGSVIRGMMAARKAAPPAGDMPENWRRALVSFPQGMQSLPRHLADRFTALGGRLLTGRKVTTLAQSDGGWQVQDDSGTTYHAAQVLVTIPAGFTANLVEGMSLSLADDLRAIPYAPMIAVALGYAAKDVGHPFDGFGGLIPRLEGRRTLGALFASAQFPGRAPEGHHLMNVFLGGRNDETITALDDAALLAQVQSDLGDLMGLRAPPVWHRIHRMPHAIPQYEVGHLSLLQRIDGAVAQMPGLGLIGSWRDGISVGDCLASGQRAAAALLGQTA